MTRKHLVLLYVLVAPTVVVKAACNPDPSVFGECSNAVPPVSCYGFSDPFCEDQRYACENACYSKGCYCIWVEDNNSCRGGSGHCHWKGTCAAVPDPDCHDIIKKDNCIAAEGCVWRDDPRGRTPSESDFDSPLPLNECTFEIQKIGECLARHKHPDCLACSLGKDGINVPQGGFKNCDQVQQEYCKTTDVVASNEYDLPADPLGYIAGCCGECEAEVIEWVKCLYGCFNVDCSLIPEKTESAVSDSPVSDPPETPSETMAVPPNLRRTSQ